MMISVSIKSSRCSFNRLVGIGSRAQLLVADFFTSLLTLSHDNRLKWVNDRFVIGWVLCRDLSIGLVAFCTKPAMIFSIFDVKIC